MALVSALLEIRDASKAFGGVQAVTRVSLEAQKGEILSVIGPNGAGKTTVLNMISGFYHPDTGRVVLEGRDVTDLAPKLVTEIYEIVARLNRDEGVAVLLAEQNATMALQVAQHGYVMENGRIVLDGDAKTISQNEDIKEFYLGLTGVGQRKSYRDVKHYRRRKRWLS